MTTSPPDSFIQHPELKNLLRALQLCKGFGLYFARCNTVALRDELVAAMKTKLNKPIIELSLKPENDIFIDAQMTALLADAGDDAVVFIYDLEKLFYLKDRHVVQELNWRRGFYGRLNHPVVFWLPEFLLTEIFNEAPDFADWRSGLYEFSLSQPEQLNLMTDTWQSINENFVGQLSLSEKQRWIVNLQNLLAELHGRENSKTKGDLLNRLGLLYKSIGRYEEALECFRQALHVQQDIGDKQGEGTTLNNISQIYRVKGDNDTAIRYLTQALQIQRDIGDKQGEGPILNNLAAIAHAKGDNETALRYFTQALQISQDIGEKQGEGTTLNNISQIHHDKGDYDTTLWYLMQALQIHQNTGDKQGEATTLNNISQIYRVKGDNDTALWYLTQSLQIMQDIGNKEGEGVTLNNISQTYDAKGDYNTALRYLTQALQIQQNIGHKKGECATLINIGHIYRRQVQPQQAQTNWLKAYQIAKQIGLAEALQNLDKLAKDMSGDGLDYWEKLSLAESVE